MNIIKKHVMSLLIVASFVSYALYRNDISAGVPVTQESLGNLVTGILGSNNQISKVATKAPVVLPKATKSNKPINNNPVGPANNIPAPAPVVVPKVVGKYKDGTYTGDVVDAYYGDMQVEVVVSGGKITDVNILKSPDGRSTSVRINDKALRILKQETIVAQSAKVDSVSGASYSSPAYIESLTSALAQAKI
ncbi:MAG: FMN-binding protein [Candidatus Pacebacteria bacterium]|nr:FMN-binding protein [Candidatus Paceibacterota bacterium]